MFVKHQIFIAMTIIILCPLLFFLFLIPCVSNGFSEMASSELCYFQASDVFTGFLRTALHLCLLRCQAFQKFSAEG